MTSRPMPVATIRPCSHRGGGHINARGDMICGNCGRIADETNTPTAPVYFEQD